MYYAKSRVSYDFTGSTQIPAENTKLVLQCLDPLLPVGVIRAGDEVHVPI